MNKVVVVIPIYKEVLSTEEIISYTRCCRILKGYPISIITYASLDYSFYKKIAIDYGIQLNIELFDDNFFKSVHGYNMLMLSECFYERFIQYEYMLIYQLDAYIFEDKLLLWCDKGYDFIGAPLLEDKYGWENKYIIPHSNNGGFSLRRIRYCLDFLSYKGPLLKFKSIYAIQKCELKNSKLKNLILSFIKAIGYHNTVGYFVNKTYYNEDLLFCLTFDVGISWINVPLHNYETYIHPQLPSAKESAAFSLERFPKFFVEKYGKFPMGCHAWHKNIDYWKNYIGIYKEK